MEAQAVLTPKAVLLMARIKRNLAERGMAGATKGKSWGYEEMVTLCQGVADPELDTYLGQLKDEMGHRTPPGTWSIC